VPVQLDVLIKLLAAVVMGGIVGWQRETRERPAGLRTHVLVCVGACVYTLASVSFLAGSDPSRVAAQVATGMGFLGAGTIIRHGNVVRGLTTAASLWAVAAVGICIGIGGPAYWVAVLATLVVLLSLTVLQRIEKLLGGHGIPAACVFRLGEGPEQMAQVYEWLAEKQISVESFSVSRPEPGLIWTPQRSARRPPGWRASRGSSVSERGVRGGARRGPCPTKA